MRKEVFPKKFTSLAISSDYGKQPESPFLGLLVLQVREYILTF